MALRFCVEGLRQAVELRPELVNRAGTGVIVVNHGLKAGEDISLSLTEATSQRYSWRRGFLEYSLRLVEITFHGRLCSSPRVVDVPQLDPVMKDTTIAKKYHGLCSTSLNRDTFFAYV